MINLCPTLIHSLIALKGFPRKIKGDVNVRKCGRIFTELNIRARCEVGGYVYTDEDFDYEDTEKNNYDEYGEPFYSDDEYDEFNSYK